MCSGAALLYKIPTIIIGDNLNFCGPEEYVKSRGVELVVLNDQEIVRMMATFIRESPQIWNEDIGEP
jgi:cytosine deaminase